MKLNNDLLFKMIIEEYEKGSLDYLGIPNHRLTQKLTELKIYNTEIYNLQNYLFQLEETKLIKTKYSESTYGEKKYWIKLTKRGFRKHYSPNIYKLEMANEFIKQNLTSFISLIALLISIFAFFSSMD